MGNNIQWDILRAPPVDTPPCDRYISDCLEDLKPGDHIEIQWKSRREIPYDWWNAVIGHMESCNENENFCCCRYSGENSFASFGLSHVIMVN
ncbi:F-box protein [Spatholobus suberectus]|nr:F-box protein [Spatholobus suberectus]